jgi:hypothetical protein
MPAEYYVGWSGGTIGVTNPIQGTELSSAEMASALCQKALGQGYRMAEFHDGKWVSGMDTDRYYGDTWPAPGRLSSGGWSFYAFGNVPSDTRFWVYINDQPANCWD